MEPAPIGPLSPLDMLPIIHAGPLQLIVREFESEGFDEVEGGLGCGAEAGDISRVGRYFRLQ